MTRRTQMAFWSLLALQYVLGQTIATRMSSTEPQAAEKAEATIPTQTLSPPEGNTTFLGGTTWCVARPGASSADLQVALDWACGLGRADCGPIQANGPCFEPNSLVSHASFAFNSYYQQNGNSDIACYFGGTASLTRVDPSFAKCEFPTSGSLKSSATCAWKYGNRSVWLNIIIISLLMLLMCIVS